ncbi:MAG: pyrroline-5-carboxylate reductase [Actinobacteria bacterium]|nr:pyrroline-5-carboxylate reductase [Actinomycetota bacterium]
MENKQFEFGVIGAGKMGGALIKGLSFLKGSQNICFFELSKERAEEVVKETNAVFLESAGQVFANSEITIISVKPDQVKSVLEEIKNVKSDSVLVSIAAGVTTDYYRKFSEFKVVRAMPNLPAVVGKGVTAVARSRYVSEDEFIKVIEVFKSVGEVVVLEEDKINAATALSGSGPAFVFRFLEALKEAGIEIGLPAKVAEKMALETILGACELFRQSGLATSELIEMVSSPGGTTIAGLKKLEKHSFKYAVMEAVNSAYERAKKLGKRDD